MEGDIVEFKAKESVTSVAKLLVRFHDNFEEYRLSVTTYFYRCVGTTMLDTRHTCNYYIVRQRSIINKESLCIDCGSIKRGKERQLISSRKITTRLNPIVACNIPKLAELRTQARKMIYYRDNRIKELITKLRLKKENMGIPVGRVKDVLLQATNCISSNMEIIREEITNIFVGLQFNDNIGKTTRIEEEEYTNYVCEGIANMKRKLMKGGKCCRFSPHIINTAMSLYLRNRKSYEELKYSGLLCLPDPRHLRRISGSLKVVEGGDPMIYSIFQEEIQKRKSDNCKEWNSI